MGRPRTSSSRATSRLDVTRAQRTGARSANSCFERSAAVADRPDSGRAAALALAECEPDLRDLFGQTRGPEPLVPGEPVAERGIVPAWLMPELSQLAASDNLSALLERAPVDLRVNTARAVREDMQAAFEGASLTPLSPWGIRLPPDTRVDDHPESPRARRSPGRG